MSLYKFSQGHSIDSEFAILAHSLAAAHNRWGVPLKPYVSEDLPHFSKLPEPHKVAVISGLKENALLFDEMNENGEQLSDTPQLLWRSLKRLGYYPASDLLDKISHDDVVELYSANRLQLFRNLNFFKYVSLSLEEVVSFTPYDLCEYDPIIIQYMENVVERINNQTFMKTEAATIPPYTIKELKGEGLKIRIQMKWLSPALQDGRCVGAILVHRAELVG